MKSEMNPEMTPEMNPTHAPRGLLTRLNLRAARGLSRRARQGERGMTLLEIMIVVAILGLLATVVVSNLMNKFNNAKVQTTKLKISEVKSTINQYYTVVGEYPNSMNDLVNPPDGLSAFFDKVPQDAWGKELIYKSSPNGDTFEVMSLGKDGQRGTKDDLK